MSGTKINFHTKREGQYNYLTKHNKSKRDNSEDSLI